MFVDVWKVEMHSSGPPHSSWFCDARDARIAYGAQCYPQPPFIAFPIFLRCWYALLVTETRGMRPIQGLNSLMPVPRVPSAEEPLQ